MSPIVTTASDTEGITRKEATLIIGVQANVWTEYMKTPEHVEYMAFPRALALAEVAWTPQPLRSYDDFVLRMRQHLKRLKAMGVNARDGEY